MISLSLSTNSAVLARAPAGGGRSLQSTLTFPWILRSVARMLLRSDADWRACCKAMDVRAAAAFAAASAAPR
eukprot:6208580-Pleurochrysis_carterae.AAC.1